MGVLQKPGPLSRSEPHTPGPGVEEAEGDLREGGAAVALPLLHASEGVSTSARVCMAAACQESPVVPANQNIQENEFWEL